MSIINGVGRFGIRSYVSPTTSYLLDTYGGAATAYSLRKLSSTYAGFAIRVRRSSDNTEQNIGFDGSGNLDTTALLAFVGSGNGFVTTWYDQSSAVRTMIQPTATSQPTIVSAGSLISRNGKPIIKFNSTNHLYMINDGYVSFDSSNHSFFMTYEKDSMTNKAILINNGGSYLFLDYNTNITNGNNVFSQSIPTNSFKLISLTNTWATSRKFYMNNSVIGVLSGSSAGGCSFATIASPSYTQGTIYTNEVVTYANDQVSNIDSINNNINSYYSIYTNYVAPTTSSSIITNGLILNLDASNVASYPGTGTTWTDLSGNGNVGALVNGTAYSSENGGTLVFDGINDYVSINNGVGLNIGNTNTFSIWVNFNRYGTVLAGAFEFWSGYLMYVDSSNTIYTAIGGSYTSFSGTNLTANKWVCLTLVRSSGSVTLYKNGFLIGTGSLNTYDNTIRGIGAYGNGDFCISGKIASVQIYNRDLVASEVLQNVNATKSRFGELFT